MEDGDHVEMEVGWERRAEKSVVRFCAIGGDAAMDYPIEDRFSRRALSSSEKETVPCP